MDRNRPHLYLMIAESLRRRIATGELKPGDRLPPVRTMAERWDCTPGTVSRAYRVLAREGLLVSQPGKGTRVTPNPLQEPATAWGWAELVNRAERYLLEALHNGHSPLEAETALTVAAARLQELQSQGQPPALVSPDLRLALRFVGSHDLLIELIAQLLRERHPPTQLSIEYAGSLGGLIALARHEADLAGIHLWDAVTDSYNSAFIHRLLPGRRVALLTLAHRHLGLIVPPGNPQAVHGLADLARPEVSYINRQPGSGTRVWLDAQLRQLGVQPESVAGYDRQETTHLGIGNAVARGTATAGLGIHAAATSLGLSFVPLTLEQYGLVIPAEIWELPAVRALAMVVRSARLKEAIQTLGGYATVETGQVTWLPEAPTPRARERGEPDGGPE